MPGFEYTICQGESLADLARRYRVEGGWQAIWDDEHNEELRRLRGDPGGLCPGDRIFIPGAEGNVAEAPSGGAVDYSAPPPFRIYAEDGSSMPPTAVPVRGEMRMKAVHDDRASGRWMWTTPSAKITLSNHETDTVTITAGANVSAGVSAEEIRLTFVPADGGTSEGTPEASSEAESSEESSAEAAPSEPVSSEAPDDSAAEAGAGGPAYVTTRLTVISVTFTATPLHGYGFDGMGADIDSPTPAGSTPHFSVKKNTRGRVMVTVRGGAGGGVLRFTSDDTSIAEPVTDGTPPAAFTIFIDGKAQDKAETLIHARANADDGPICASLAVNVYREMTYTGKVAKVWDSTSPSTALSRPSFSVATAQTTVRGAYKQAVTTITLTDYSSGGGLIDVNFDPGGAGALVLEAGRTSTGEQAIKNALTGTGNKIVVVKNLTWLFKLNAAAPINATTITLSSHLSAEHMAYITSRTYRFGGPGNYEDITVTATDTATRVVTLAAGLTKAHPATEGIWWPLGGLSGNPAWVKEGNNTEEKVNWIIAHEFGHELLGILDLEKLECMMHFSNSRTGMKMRFKELPRHYNPPGGNENQWDCISRSEST